MQFEFNGEVQEATAPLNVRALLDRLELTERRVAVAVNDEVVPRSRFETVEIRDGDRVEVIQAVGGG